MTIKIYHHPVSTCGAAVFAAETAMPNLLHAALVEVSVARGVVLDVERDETQSRPGVVDVVGRAQAVDMLRPTGSLSLILSLKSISLAKSSPLSPLKRRSRRGTAPQPRSMDRSCARRQLGGRTR